MRHCRRYVIAALIPGVLSSGFQAPPKRPLFKDSRAQLALARVRQDSTVLLVIAAVPGGAGQAARAIARLGGEIRYRNDRVDYLRARVPVGQIEELADSPAILAADVSVSTQQFGERPVLLHTPDPGAARLAPPGGVAMLRTPVDTPPWPPRRSDYPLRHPYSPLKDLGAEPLLAKHPTFDGRGVTIAVLDGNVDLLLPEFQTALTLDGKPTRKLVGFRNSMDPREEPPDEWGQWVAMATRVRSREGTFRLDSVSYRTPRDGVFRFGAFDERRFSSEYLGQDINRDGNPDGASRVFAVLWSPESNAVWVDSDQDRDFADEREMTDYEARYDIGVFGKDDPATPLREAIGFAVQTDRAKGYVAINIGYYQHGTMVAGVAVANAQPSGRVHGVAPGARLVSIFHGGAAYSMIEGLIQAFGDPLVDIIVLEQSFLVDGPYFLSDGRSVASIIIDRLAASHPKPLFVPAGNPPGLQRSSELAVGRGVGVGAYQSRENYRINAAIVPVQEDNQHLVGSHGPAGNGAVVPEFVNPTAIVTTFPAYMFEASLPGPVELPAGYAICGGTSCAAPVAAASAALLVSGAKQTGIRYDPERLRQALTSTTRFIPTIEAHRQGSGLLQLSRAWDLLRRWHVTGAPARIRSRAPVRTLMSGWLEPAHRGMGLFEREGWAPGDSGERRVVLRRITGPREPLTFSATLVGDDSTFTVPDSITLPLERDVAVPVRVTPSEVGVKAALLTLDQPGIPGRAAQVGLTVVAAHQFRPADGYRVRAQLKVPRPGSESFFILVPPEVAALRVEVESPETVRLYLHGPDGREDFGDLGAVGEPRPRVISHPTPGVWEVLVFNINDAFEFSFAAPQPLPPTTVTLSASLLGIDVAAALGPGGSPAGGDPTGAQMQLTNRWAAVSASTVSMPLGSANETTARIGPREQQLYEIVVPVGSTRLAVRVDSVSDAGADLDLYLFDCTAKRCVAVASGVSPWAQEQISVNDPAPGRWRVVVDAANVPSAGVSYRYLDIFLNPRYGSISTADPMRLRETGSKWSTRLGVWTADSVGGDRVPFGITSVQARVGGRPGPGDVLGIRVPSERESIELGLSLIRLGPKPATR